MTSQLGKVTLQGAGFHRKLFEPQTLNSFSMEEIIKRTPYFLAEIAKPHTEAPAWTTPHEVVLKTSAFHLLQFRGGKGRPIVLGDPQAGHRSGLINLFPGKNQVETALKSSKLPVYGIDWQSCTPERRNESVWDLVCQVNVICEFLGMPIHFVGNCQCGWLAGMLAYFYPDMVSTWIAAGSPLRVDVDRDESSVCKLVDVLPKEFYEYLIALGNGVMSGKLMLMGWKSGNFIERYFTDFLSLFNAIDTDDFQQSVRFRSWYECTADIPGNWFLSVTEDIFRCNRLYKGEMQVGDGFPRLQEIQEKGETKVITIAGGNDDISPKNQAHGIPADEQYLIPEVGHIGCFVSGKAQELWWNIFSELKS